MAYGKKTFGFPFFLLHFYWFLFILITPVHPRWTCGTYWWHRPKKFQWQKCRSLWWHMPLWHYANIAPCHLSCLWRVCHLAVTPYIYIYTVHMFFQHEVIGSSSWLMLLFRIGEPFQNSRDIRKKLIMSAADSHKHKHVKHNKRTLWVTCFFLVAFLNCLPFPKSRSIRTSGTSSRERACPRACWILAFLQSQLWARRCLEKSRLFLLTQMITWDTYGYVVVFF